MEFAQIIPYILFALAATLGLFGVWLIIGGDTVSERGTVQSRLQGGVRQIKRLELGDSLAKTREEEERKKERRREAIKKQAFSDIPAIDLALQNTSWAEKLNGWLLQCQMPMSVTSFVLLSLLLAALGTAFSMIWRGEAAINPVLALLFAVLFGFSPFVYVWAKVARRRKMFSQQLPDALDLISSSVKGGQSLNAALQNVAEEMPEPVCDEFRILADELTFGVEFNVALRHLLVRMDTDDVRFFVAALQIQKETGGNLAEVLDGLQHTIRERYRILGQVKTLTAQGKLSGLIVAALPIVLAALIYMLNEDYMGTMFTEDLGKKMILAALVWQGIGVFLIYKIVNIEV